MLRIVCNIVSAVMVVALMLTGTVRADYEIGIDENARQDTVVLKGEVVEVPQNGGVVIGKVEPVCRGERRFKIRNQEASVSLQPGDEIVFRLIGPCMKEDSLIEILEAR